MAFGEMLHCLEGALGGQGMAADRHCVPLNRAFEGVERDGLVIVGGAQLRTL